jgi:uncharacterized protein (TIGR02246 family)
MSTRNVTENTLAHLAIRDLLDRYTDALNRRDWGALQTLFTADGVWDAGGPEMGAQAFRFETAAACAAGIAGLVSPAELCVQSNHAVVIEVRGDSASARTTVNELVLLPGAPGLMTIWGTYHDDLRREADGEWRFRERRFRYTWIDPAGAKGQVLARFPAG